MKHVRDGEVTGRGRDGAGWGGMVTGWSRDGHGIVTGWGRNGDGMVTVTH